MYISAANRIDDPQEAFALVDAYGFATLVTETDGVPWASHLPVLLDRTEGSLGRLRSHMARANEQWRHFDPTREVLCIFLGPHAYISPTWYASEVGVPTWNYAVVHVYGFPKVEGDPSRVRRIIDDTTNKYEAKMANPWTPDLPDATMNAMLKAIVGFTISITRIETKFKLGQNRSLEDQENMLLSLENSSDPAAHALAGFIRNQQ